MCRFGDGLHVQGIRRVSRGLCPRCLGFFLGYGLLVGGSVCAMVCGAVLGSGRGGLVTCLEARQFPLAWSVLLSMYVCRCACGLQYGGRVAPLLCVSHSVGPWVCVQGGFLAF
jgi:hypothetical protein